MPNNSNFDLGCGMAGITTNATSNSDFTQMPETVHATHGVVGSGCVGDGIHPQSNRRREAVRFSSAEVAESTKCSSDEIHRYM